MTSAIIPSPHPMFKHLAGDEMRGIKLAIAYNFPSLRGTDQLSPTKPRFNLNAIEIVSI